VFACNLQTSFCRIGSGQKVTATPEKPCEIHHHFTRLVGRVSKGYCQKLRADQLLANFYGENDSSAILSLTANRQKLLHLREIFIPRFFADNYKPEMNIIFYIVIYVLSSHSRILGVIFGCNFCCIFLLYNVGASLSRTTLL
jgi:hypothetical protein